MNSRWIWASAVLGIAVLAGDSHAVVPVEGSVRFGPTNTLTIELGTTTPGDFDRLEVQGDVEAGGTVVFNGAFSGAASFHGTSTPVFNRPASIVRRSLRDPQ